MSRSFAGAEHQDAEDNAPKDQCRLLLLAMDSSRQYADLGLELRYRLATYVDTLHPAQPTG